MKVALAMLLRERPVTHPTQIAEVTFQQDALHLVVAGYRWWSAPTEPGEGRISLAFAGFNIGLLDAELLLNRNWDEALDNLAVRPLAEEPWADIGITYSIYCQRPLPDPLAVHAVVHDLLLASCAPYGADHYLNGAESIARFRRLTATTNYLLGTFPAAMHALLVSELERQQATFTVLTQERAASTQQFVILGNGSFICDEAWAEWDG